MLGKAHAADQVTGVEIDRGHVCSTDACDTVWCWGADEAIHGGITGMKSTFNQTGAWDVATGAEHACALWRDAANAPGTVECWGSKVSSGSSYFPMVACATASSGSGVPSPKGGDGGTRQRGVPRHAQLRFHETGVARFLPGPSTFLGRVGADCANFSRVPPIQADEAASALASALTAFELSPDLMLVVDRDLRLVARNDAAATSALQATDPADCFAIETRETFRAVVAHVLSTAEPSGFEWGEAGMGGVRRWYSANVVPVKVDGEVIGAIACSRDVTEMKKQEERLRRSEQLMVDTQGVAHLGTWEWDVTQPVAVWSDELYRIYGLTPETYTPSYEAYLTMVHDDDRQRVIDATNRVFHEHVPYSHDERIWRPDGSLRYLHTWAHPVVDQTGKLLRLVGVCQDITDRMEAQEAVRSLNSELEQRVSDRTRQLQTALRDLETFNSMVSHDLRSPLSVIQMAIDMIEQQPGIPDTVVPILGRARRAVEGASKLVTNLLTFARVGHGSLQPEEVDATVLCAELVSEQRQEAKDRQVDVRVEPSLRLHVDPTLFRAALSNLIGNAWKYTARSASPGIEIGTVHRQEGRALFVRDNGIGFDMKERDLMFRPFTRLGNAKEFQGTGIGLATVERVVERHGGSIVAEGALGHGATFFLLLPETVWR